MHPYADITLAQLDMITTFSSSEKATVSLVSVKDSAQMAVLKEYTRLDLQEFYLHIQQLQSAYLPELYRVWEEQGHTYLLEEYISGKTLRDILDGEETLQQTQLQSYMEDLCRALETLHQAAPSIIHRDIKPENIMITADGSLKLLDMDAAREYKESLERDTVLLGTREYAPPEQFGFMQTDVRSDIYSVGVVFAELLEHASVTKEYRKKAGRIVSEATMFDPEKRYGHVGGLLKDLRMLQKRPGRRGRIPVMVAILLAGVLLTCVGTGFLQQTHRADRMPEQLPAMGVSGAAWGIIDFTESIPQEEEKVILPITVPLEAAYTYQPTEEEVQRKIDMLMNDHPKFYNIQEDPYEDDGFYAPYQECIIGRDYITVRFLKSCPRDLIFRDQRMEGYDLIEVYLEPYIEETGMNGERILIDTSGYQQRCENIISISGEYLMSLAPGAYTLSVKMENSRGSFWISTYLVVHGEEEAMENCRLNLYGDIAYYSSETRNDVFFYVLNTPYPIDIIEIDGVPAQEGDYQLVEKGYGVVFSAEFLKRHEEQETMELTFVAENGKYTEGRIIFLQHFE